MSKPAALASLDALMGAMAQAVQKVGPRLVDVPELGGAVYVLPINTADILLFDERQPPESATPEQQRAWQIARLLSDADGRRLVQPDNLPFLDLVARLPWDASKRITDAAGRDAGGDPNAG